MPSTQCVRGFIESIGSPARRALPQLRLSSSQKPRLQSRSESRRIRTEGV